MWFVFIKNKYKHYYATLFVDFIPKITSHGEIIKNLPEAV
jgi:hypothetical protein